MVLLAAPKSCYKGCGNLVLRGARSGADLGDVDVGGGRAIHVAESAKYLGSLAHRDGSDRPDVLARIKSLPRVRLGAYGARRLNWQKLFSGAVSLVCWRLRRWFPAARLTYGVQVGWNYGSIRHLVPPQGSFPQHPRN